MPLYEFRCPACAAEFSKLLLRYDPEALASVECPECGHRKVVKRISTFASSVRSGRSRSAACAPSG